MDLWNKNKMLPIFKCDYTTSSTQILMLYIYYKNLYIHSCIYIFIYLYIYFEDFHIFCFCWFALFSTLTEYYISSLHFISFNLISFNSLYTRLSCEYLLPCQLYELCMLLWFSKFYGTFIGQVSCWSFIMAEHMPICKFCEIFYTTTDNTLWRDVHARTCLHTYVNT